MSWIVLIVSGVLEAVWAVWVGIGASLTLVYSMATGLEPVSALKIAFLAMIIGGVIGLKVVH